MKYIINMTNTAVPKYRKLKINRTRACLLLKIEMGIFARKKNGQWYYIDILMKIRFELTISHNCRVDRSNNMDHPLPPPIGRFFFLLLFIDRAHYSSHPAGFEERARDWNGDRNITINTDSIIERFARPKNRKTTFVL